MSSIRLRAAHATPTSGGSQDTMKRKDRVHAQRERWESWHASGDQGFPSRDDASADGVSSAELSSTAYPLHMQYQNDVTYRLPGDFGPGRLGREEKTRLEDFHVTYRTPLHVPDNAYRAYRQGQAGKRKKNASVLTKSCCLHTCTGFSVVAVIFLCFIGILIDNQPLLMKGMMNRRLILDTSDGGGKLSVRYMLPTETEVLQAARSAYRAALAYFFCIIFSLYALNPVWFQSQLYRFHNKYQDIPDHVSSADSTLPQFHTANGIDGSAAPGFMTGIWNRCAFMARQWLANNGLYRPGARRKNDRKTG
jgi:hypothetical protein